MNPRDLVLSPIAGPEVDPIDLTGAGPVTVGRSRECSVRLNDPAVSRRHAVFTRAGDGWAVTDAGSRHGVRVNSAPVAPGEPTPIGPGDRVRLGPWLFRVRDASAPSTIRSIDDTADAGTTRVSRIQIGDLASRRLDLLMRVARTIQDAEDETAVAAAVVRSLVEGSGFDRAAVIRPVRGLDEIEILAAHHRSEPSPIRPSRTLIRAAAAGGVARLEDQTDAQHAVSIVSANVASALCAAVTIGGETDAFVYLDGASSPHADAGAFCAAVADLCALAIANIRRRTLQRRQDRLLRDLETARRVQERLMPPAAGVVGPVRYALRFQPGRVVAGDFAGVRDLGAGRAAIFLGDVAGKGLGASLLMATIQARLDTLLETGAVLDEIVNRLNGYLAERTATGEFATLFACVLDAGAGTLACVDAGHGYAMLHRGGAAELLTCDGGPPVGVDPDTRYARTDVAFEPGDRLILMSDGVPEQPDPAGEQLGVDRAGRCLAGSADPESDVAGLVCALVGHTRRDSFADDVTILSIALR